ncbi:MAG: hypothetical protein GEU79_17740, partial [Acidimicrobiia bacterium]|nr:hypothetical protein [Acidimicrobiia bacterium]
VRCGAFNLGYDSGLESANPNGTPHDLATCPDLALTRGAVAYYLSSALKLPPASGDTFRDDDGMVYEEAIDQINEAGITGGCGKEAAERFCPKSYVSRGQIAVFLVRALDLPETSSDVFVDDEDSPYEDAINRSASAGITTGCNPPANDRFCPDERVTRSQLLEFLKAGIDLGPAPVNFEDIDESVFERDILWLAAAGITTGCNPPVNDRFCPQDPVTRGEMAAFITRALHLPAAVGDHFSDDDSSVFEDDIERVAAAGITMCCNPPENDHFCPESAITRGEMAAFLTRGLELPPAPNPFRDSLDDVFAEEIGALHGAGITRGCNPPVNDLYCPGSKITRGEMAALLHRGLGDG